MRLDAEETSTTKQGPQNILVRFLQFRAEKEMQIPKKPRVRLSNPGGSCHAVYVPKRFLNAVGFYFKI